MLEITIGDLLELEPKLSHPAPLGMSEKASASALDRPVSWAISVRSTPPHLPSMRGGEILFLSSRAIAGVGDELPALVREVTARGVAAVVAESAETSTGGRDVPGQPIWLRWEGAINAAAENGLNRQLTEFRGDLYRVGSELERRISDAAFTAEGLETLVADVAAVLGMSVRLRFADGQIIDSEAPVADGTMPVFGSVERVVEKSVAEGVRLEIGSVSPAAAITARLLADRLASGFADALRRDRAARPRGDRRFDVLSGLLAEGVESTHRRSAARGLGFDPDGTFVVAVVSGGGDRELGGLFAAVGETHMVGMAGAESRLVVPVNPRLASAQLTSRIGEIKQRWRLHHPETDSMLALSSPVVGVEQLPTAAWQATSLAALQRRWPSLPPAASFDVVADVGVLPLLFWWRDTGPLARFVSDAIGPLQSGDRRGTLRETLRTYLECGGSQVDAADRLGIHRNTLAYRLRRISELTGRDVTKPGSWLVLHLALLAADLLAVVPEHRHSPRTGH